MPKGLKCEKNPLWKGDDVGYASLHAWIKRRKKKPSKCTSCNKKTNTLDLANISQKYKRDTRDFEYLCRICHMKKDGRIEKLVAFSKNNNFNYQERINSNNWKNRRIPKGIEVNTNKLSAEDVKLIRIIASSRTNYMKIGKDFGVKAACISKIMNNITWRWLKSEESNGSVS